MQSFTIPVHVIVKDSVTSIGAQTFWGCSGLTSIVWNGTTYTNVDDFLTAFENSKE